ncbi:restriction endonuclease subunit S [Glaciecola sp. MF2-115]|uniref:restriction endonuclease subunit S n=1 Tax=Glaciecola sp. MF2-115 TaxID=3384827 RepID=UPI0039A12257
MRKQTILLKDIAEIKAGHPFRGRIQPENDGAVRAVQLKDVDKDGLIVWDSLVKTEITGRKVPNWLQKGDILFAARGFRNVAAYIDTEFKNIVCAQHFFHIRLHTNTILPEFLAWHLNQHTSQKHFAKYSQGSAVASIPRGFLASTPLSVPDINQQQTAVSFYNACIREKQILQTLIKNRELQMEGVAKQLLSKQ